MLETEYSGFKLFHQNDTHPHCNDDKDCDLKLLVYLYSRMLNMGYIQYKKKKNGVLDVVSKIGALFSI